jgi:hypothetical protein
MYEEIKIKTFCKCGQQLNEDESYTQYSLKGEILCFNCFSKEVDAACRLYNNIISL